MAGKLQGWIDGFSADVKTVEGLLGEPAASGPARVLAAAALSYMITKLDLVPDWEDALGVVDDAMVLRVACALASERGLGKLPEELERKVAALANQADAVDAVVGAELAPIFRKYVANLELPANVVRGRTAAQLVENAKLREKLSAELAEELRKLPVKPIGDEAAATKILMNYLNTKLKPVKK